MTGTGIGRRPTTSPIRHSPSPSPAGASVTAPESPSRIRRSHVEHLAFLAASLSPLRQSEMRVESEVASVSQSRSPRTRPRLSSASSKRLDLETKEDELALPLCATFTSEPPVPLRVPVHADILLQARRDVWLWLAALRAGQQLGSANAARIDISIGEGSDSPRRVPPMANSSSDVNIFITLTSDHAATVDVLRSALSKTALPQVFSNTTGALNAATTPSDESFKTCSTWRCSAVRVDRNVIRFPERRDEGGQQRGETKRFAVRHTSSPVVPETKVSMATVDAAVHALPNMLPQSKPTTKAAVFVVAADRGSHDELDDVQPVQPRRISRAAVETKAKCINIFCEPIKSATLPPLTTSASSAEDRNGPIDEDENLIISAAAVPIPQRQRRQLPPSTQLSETVNDVNVISAGGVASLSLEEKHLCPPALDVTATSPTVAAAAVTAPVDDQLRSSESERRPSPSVEVHVETMERSPSLQVAVSCGCGGGDGEATSPHPATAALPDGMISSPEQPASSGALSTSHRRTARSPSVIIRQTNTASPEGPAITRDFYIVGGGRECTDVAFCVEIPIRYVDTVDRSAVERLTNVLQSSIVNDSADISAQLLSNAAREATALFQSALLRVKATLQEESLIIHHDAAHALRNRNTREGGVSGTEWMDRLRLVSCPTACSSVMLVPGSMKARAGVGLTLSISCGLLCFAAQKESVVCVATAALQNGALRSEAFRGTLGILAQWLATAGRCGGLLIPGSLAGCRTAIVVDSEIRRVDAVASVTSTERQVSASPSPAPSPTRTPPTPLKKQSHRIKRPETIASNPQPLSNPLLEHVLSHAPVAQVVLHVALQPLTRRTLSDAVTAWRSSGRLASTATDPPSPSMEILRAFHFDVLHLSQGFCDDAQDCQVSFQHDPSTDDDGAFVYLKAVLTCHSLPRRPGQNASTARQPFTSDIQRDHVRRKLQLVLAQSLTQSASPALPATQEYLQVAIVGDRNMPSITVALDASSVDAVSLRDWMNCFGC